MNLVLLSGQSISNKDWIESVQKSLGDLFDELRIGYYDHWQEGQEYIDLDKEFSKLPDLVKGLGKYAVFAKSIGAVLTIRGIYEKVLFPQKCIFIGPAVLVGERSIPGFKSWIQNMSTATLYITKTSDPVAPAVQVRDLLKRHNVKNYQFREIAGDNHKYDDLAEIKKLVMDFVTSG